MVWRTNLLVESRPRWLDHRSRCLEWQNQTIDIFDGDYGMLAGRNDRWKMWVCLDSVVSHSFPCQRKCHDLAGMPHFQQIKISCRIGDTICMYGM